MPNRLAEMHISYVYPIKTIAADRVITSEAPPRPQCAKYGSVLGWRELTNSSNTSSI